MKSLGVALLFTLLAIGARADLTAVLAERNLEKRARKALENADRALKAARHAYEHGRIDPARSALEELRESVELAHASLRQTGKDPVRSPRPFKHAEIKTRALLRRLKHFQDRMAVDDREMVEPVSRTVETIHEDLLLGIMGKRKWGGK